MTVKDEDLKEEREMDEKHFKDFDLKRFVSPQL